MRAHRVPRGRACAILDRRYPSSLRLPLARRRTERLEVGIDDLRPKFGEEFVACAGFEILMKHRPFVRRYGLDERFRHVSRQALQTLLRLRAGASPPKRFFLDN